jgi:hypothetical protein
MGYYVRVSWHGRMLVHYPMRGNIKIGECPYFSRSFVPHGQTTKGNVAAVDHYISAQTISAVLPPLIAGQIRSGSWPSEKSDKSCSD